MEIGYTVTQEGGEDLQYSYVRLDILPEPKGGTKVIELNSNDSP